MKLLLKKVWQSLKKKTYQFILILFITSKNEITLKTRQIKLYRENALKTSKKKYITYNFLKILQDGSQKN